LALLIIGTAWRYLNWRNDMFEVNNQGIVHEERVPFPFPREDRYEVPLQQIQNVNIFIGVLGRLLGYGTLSIDTAAVAGQVEFTEIPGPGYVQELIQAAAAQARSGQQILFREGIRQQLEAQLYPESIRPVAPDSVLIPPPPPPPAPPTRGSRFRSLGSWLPRFEIREGNTITWRKHWFNLFQRTGPPSLVFLITFYLLVAYTLAFVTRAFGAVRPLELPPVSWLGFEGWLCLPVGVLWSIAALWVVYKYVDWRNDVYIVTDDEVIDEERRPIFFPFWFLTTLDRKQAPLAMVQNVNLVMPNLFAFLFNYGDVIVQTAGAAGNLDFLFVSNPRHVQAEVLRRLAVFREWQARREFEERGKEIGEWFEAYHSLTGRDRSDPSSG
jgi:membrane protein YdbS with pleckstrin-like domain